jgi:hypothetical protein
MAAHNGTIDVSTTPLLGVLDTNHHVSMYVCSGSCKSLKEVKGYFLDFFFLFKLFYTASSLLPPRFHCVGGCWYSGNCMTHLSLLAKLSILLVVNISSGHHGIFEVKKREARD